MYLVRKGIIAILFLVLLLTGYRPAGQCQSIATAPAVVPGVSYTLATWRSSRVRNIIYQLGFHLPATPTAAVEVEEQLSFDLSDNTAPLQIDFRKKGAGPDTLLVNGMPIPADYQQEHLLIPTKVLHTGANIIGLHFSAVDLPLNRNSDFLYTLLVPDRARTLFPCFDQPDCKAIFQLTLTLPADWKAMANAPLKEATGNGSEQTLHFLPSDRISTYLFAFVAGRFTDTAASAGEYPMHFFYRETDSAKLRLSIRPVFQIQTDALAFLQHYTKIPYPFQKFSCAAIPDFQFGGMEHPGAIQYKASSLFLDPGATRDQLIARSNLLSHETAHMWFGDLVTMSWFNDVWMKEVFANFMADKISNITLPDNKYDLKFLTDHYTAAYSVDRTEGAHPIRQQLDNLQDAGSLYGNIIYHKAPIMMRQLELLMGADAFRDGLRDYLKQYAGGNASWPELIRILGAHTTTDLNAWNKVWVNESGRPRFTYQCKTSGGKITELMIHQQGEDGSARVWPQFFTIALVYRDHIEHLPVNMNTAGIRLEKAVGKEAPLGFLFNSGGEGYGLFPVDKFLLHSLPAIKSPLMRASTYINLYENMLDGQGISPMQLLALDRAMLSMEPEELNLNILTDQISSLYWRFIPSAKRDSLSVSLEKEIWKTMYAVRSPNEKKVLFKTFSSIVRTKKGQDSLYRIWKTQEPPAGVQLSEDDYTALAATLALRAYPGEKQLLDEQLARIKNKDRRDRLIYLLPALSNDEGERDRFFETLRTPEGRKKESWVLTALGYLHHPLRTGYSEKYLPQTLALLEEVQRTGDVFFPQSWLAASLGWYRTKSAAAIVRDFLQQHPDYNPKLKAKLLQAADNLFRAANLTK